MIAYHTFRLISASLVTWWFYFYWLTQATYTSPSVNVGTKRQRTIIAV